MCPPYALLILTPDSSLAQRLFDVLARGGAAPRSMQVLTPGELQSGPVGPFDVALVHDGGPDSDAFVAMGLVRRTFKDIPMIVVADTRDDTRMVDLLHAGVADVVWLHNLDAWRRRSSASCVTSKGRARATAPRPRCVGWPPSSRAPSRPS